MVNIKKSLILCLATFAISDLIVASNLEKQDKQLSNKNLLSSITHNKNIQAIIAGYLKNEWELDRIIKTDNEIEDNEVQSVEFSPDGKNIALAHGNFIKIFEVNTRKKIQEFLGHKRSVYVISYSPNGKYLASGSGDSALKIWDLSDGSCKKTIDFVDFHAIILSIKFSPDGNKIAFGSLDHSLKTLDLQTGDLQTISHACEPVNSVIFSPIADQLASVYSKSSITLWYFYTESIKDIMPVSELQKLISQYAVFSKTFNGHEDIIWSLDFSADGKYLVSGSDDSTIKIWNAESGDCLKTLKAEVSISSVAFSCDGNYIISSGVTQYEPGYRRIGLLQVWNAKDGTCIQKISPIHFIGDYTHRPRSIKYSPSGGRIVFSITAGCIILKNEMFQALNEELG